ncbi:MAG: Stp1/IreP family PP2C-type Ser/Thr phosphatase [Acidobacteriia bacterium]|nr:Stp1/IreP family PP2C-type Ser/Thr phosphatase [Terriglobia bacterium]
MAAVRVVCGGSSDVGQVRANNEDAYRIVDELRLYVLSDGMGGEAHGEVASAIAVQTVTEHCAQLIQAAPGSARPANGNGKSAVDAGSNGESSERAIMLESAVRLANKKIFWSAEKNPAQKGMGATLTAAWIDGQKLTLAHVGDSRVYLLRGGDLHQLTSDHSLVAEQVRRGIITPAEAEKSDMQSVLLRALGAQLEVEVETGEQGLMARDVLLLCSDGLTRMVSDVEIAGALQAEGNPQKAAENLVALANENGGADNVTVIVLRLEAEKKNWLSWLWGGAGKNGK